MSDEKILIAELPEYDFVSGKLLVSTGGNADLLFALELGDRVFHAGFRFTAVRALRFCQETHCTAWHVEGAFGRLVEIRPSDWVSELTARLVERGRSSAEAASEWDMHHYLIYVPDEGGAYEVVAERWALLPDTPGPLPKVVGGVDR